MAVAEAAAEGVQQEMGRLTNRLEQELPDAKVVAAELDAANSVRSCMVTSAEL